MRKLATLTLLTAALALVSCNSTRKAGATATGADAAMVDGPSLNPLDVLSAAKSAGGLTKLSVPAALSIINGFVGLLSKKEGTEAIVGELQSLTGLLQAPKIDGGKVGSLLGSLGTKTSAAAGGTGNYALLGDALKDAGASLGM